MDPIIVQILGSFNGQRVNFSEWVASTLPLQINEKFSLLTDVVIVAAVSFEVTGCLRIGDNAKEQRAHEESEQQCVAQQIDAGCQDVQCERYRLPLVHPLLRCPLEQLHCRHCTPLSSPQFPLHQSRNLLHRYTLRGNLQLVSLTCVVGDTDRRLMALASCTRCATAKAAAL